ncbi:MAG: outer rane receptor protein [Rhodospirillales bacterium]|nr:outer rane receptor protein [Rhodospirillales bacterium]
MKNWMLGVSTLALSAGLVTHANAQSVQPVGIEEVIVTAEKRSENLQKVPISVAVLTASQLVKSGVTTLDSVQRYAPGLSMATVGSGFVSYTYLRGSGTNQLDSGSDPSVAFFVDEVYVTGTAGLQFGLFDLDRVEVLKGPQGTLFGRNAAAGAISITTKTPQAEFGGYASLDLGNFDWRYAEGAVTGPLTADGKLRFRVSGSIKERGAFTENLSGRDPGDLDTKSGRAQLEYVGDRFKFLLTGTASTARNGMTNQFLASASKAAFLTPADAAALPPGEAFYKHFYSVNGFENQDIYGLTGRLEAETALGTLTSISAYRYNSFDRSQDQDATIFDAYTLNSREKDRTLSEEVRLADQVGPVRWLGGLYFYDAHTERRDTVLAGTNFSTPAFRNTTSVDANNIHVRSYAAFGQLTYQITDQLSLTGGGRYTRDEKSDERYVKRFTSAPFNVAPTVSWNSFDPSVTLNYQVTPTVLAYASYKRGFKSGGFQTLLPATADQAAIPFAPERVNSYEAGLKSEWLDRRLRVNTALFRADIENQQVLRSLPNSINIIDNAGRTRTDGLDLTVSALVTPELQLDASLTWQHARFQQFISGTSSFAGKSQLRSPDFSSFVGAEYRYELGAPGSLTMRAEYQFQTRSFFDTANTTLPGVYQPAYGLVNLRLSFEPSQGRWSVAAWGRNVTDKQYFRNIAVSGVTGLAAPGDPATYGVSMRYEF